MKKQNSPTPDKRSDKPTRTDGDRKQAEALNKRGEQDTSKPGPLGSPKNMEQKPDYDNYGEGDAHTGEDLPSREPEHKPYVGDNPEEIREQSPKMN